MTRHDSAPRNTQPWQGDTVPVSRLSRRGFMETLGAAFGAAALQACNSSPPEKIIPYVHRPPEVIPGVGQYYATSTTRGGYGVGLLVQSHTGRPTKIEGHPEHPASMGKTLVQEQAELLALYDPDRAKAIQFQRSPATWNTFVSGFSPVGRTLTRADLRPGSTPRELLLLEPTASPLVAELLDRLRQSRPRTEIYFDPSHAPVARWNAAISVFGEVVEPHYRFDRAERVLSLDANFLAASPMSIRWARDFAAGRDLSRPEDTMSRLYVVESAVSVTGATADHRLAVRGSEVGTIAGALVHALSMLGRFDTVPSVRTHSERLARSLGQREREWAEAVAKDLLQHQGASIIVVGDHQPEPVHVLGLLLNEVLGNAGKTVTYASSPIVSAGTKAFSAERFLQAIDTGEIETTFVLGGNPAYELPADHRFAERFTRAKERVYLAPYDNETASHSDWLINRAHFLESWGLERGYDGTLSLRQPLIRPLYAGKSLEEVLAMLAGIDRPEGRSLVREYFTSRLGNEDEFTEAVRHGVIGGSRFPTKNVSPHLLAAADALSVLAPRNPLAGPEINFLPDPRIEHGRQGNNPWLLELPEPISKLVWDNAALIAPETAAHLGIKHGDVVELRNEQAVVQAPAFVSPGQARGAIVIWLGWGRSGSERNVRGVGVNASPLRRAVHPWVTPEVEVRNTGGQYQLVTTQPVQSMHDRPIALSRSKRDWQAHPGFAEPFDEAPLTLFPDRSVGAPQWGMTVDLSRCTGCSTCVVACQAENNVPVVGKQMVALGREMHWLRIDTYREEQADAPRVHLQPMLCQHCEKAPCEYVCPVNATVHSEDGLNQMVYNRCVGTRFCSNNCPYKVRRFNYFDYNQDPPEVQRMAFNPDVTVRARGVMEKCTYCVQRIRRAQIDARLQGRGLGETDVSTACQQACPTEAIVFGQVSDANSRVSKNYRNLRTYAVLNELGTRPRTRYLARIHNLNEEIPR